MESDMDEKQDLTPVQSASSSANALTLRSSVLARRGLEQLGAEALLSSTITTLSLAIAAATGVRAGAFHRVQRFATALAEAVGLSGQEKQGVTTAALLRDVGKLAVPQHILWKKGPLTQEEFEKIRLHPHVGAEIISALPFPYPVAPLILSHHERWDGKGYPQGLKGEEIPLGARILSVVDYYSALTSDQPYHNAMTSEAALALVREEAGRALDPAIVHMFAKTAAEMEATEDAMEAPRSMPHTVFEDIALANRETQALYEIAQTMGTSLGVADTMASFSSKLSDLLPFSACALFLFDEEQDVLRCRFAAGIEGDAIGGMTVRAGQGLSGWVARNRRTLVNARPSAEFEAAGLAETTTLQSALVAPLAFSERLIGTLAVYSTQADFYTDNHRRLFDQIIEQVSAVIHNSIVFEQTQEDALTDLTTGLPNQRFLFMHLTREFGRALKLKAEVALLVMDLDDFKNINNAYGDHVGDRVLRETGALVRSAIRSFDICVRYSSDEFMVVLSGCGAEEAERKRLEIQHLVDGLKFEPQPGKFLPLSISIGAAVYPHDGDSFETLLGTADARLHRDKLNRKNRT
jgi:diguanylate cyclase (GGDEF)-like protein